MVAAHSTHPHPQTVAACIDVRQLAEHLLGDVGKRSGKAIVFSNPKLEQQTPSFTVYADGFKDFATDERGDVFDLIQLATGCDFPAALRYAAAFAGIAMDRPDLPLVKAITRISQASARNDAQWRHTAEQEVARCAAYLWSDAPNAHRALAYLRNVRGLSDATIRAAQLGYNNSWHITEYIKSDGKPASLAPGIVIPWRDDIGDILAIRVRCRVGNLAEALTIPPDTGKDNKPLPKYISFSGSTFGGTPYGTRTAGVDVLIVEGEFDALLAAQHVIQDGLPLAVITAGSASGSLTTEHVKRLEIAPRVFLALDNDEAGTAGHTRLLDTLYNTAVYTAKVPTGKDITEYLVSHGGMLSRLLTTAQRVALPDTWRVALNTFVQPTVAPVIDLYLEACRSERFCESDGVTVAELVAHGQALGRNVSEATIRRGLAQGQCGGFFAELPTYSPTPKKRPSSNGKIANNRGGRSVKRYQLVAMPSVRRAILTQADPRLLEKHFGWGIIAPIRSDLLSALEVPDAEIEATVLQTRYSLRIETDAQRSALEMARQACQKLRAALRQMHSTVLPSGWHFENAATYRAVYARAALAVYEGEQLSRVELAAKVGVSPRSMYGVLAKAGLRGEQRYAERTITDVTELEPLAARYSPEYEGYAKWLVVEDHAYRLDQVDCLQVGKAVARTALAEGRPVIIKYQQRSALRIVAALQPVPLEKHEQLVKPLPPPAVPAEEHLPRFKPFYGVGHDPRWAEAQLIALLTFVSAWQRQSNQLRNGETGELLPYTVKTVLALLLDKPLPSAIAVETASRLHSEMCLAERVSQAAGQVIGVGRMRYLSGLMTEERTAVLRFADGEEW